MCDHLTDMKSAKNSAFFDTHFGFFEEHFFGVLLVLFGNFGAKFASNRAKYWKMLFFKQVLEFYFTPISTLGSLSC